MANKFIFLLCSILIVFDGEACVDNDVFLGVEFLNKGAKITMEYGPKIYFIANTQLPKSIKKKDSKLDFKHFKLTHEDKNLILTPKNPKRKLKKAEHYKIWLGLEAKQVFVEVVFSPAKKRDKCPQAIVNTF